MAQKDWQEMALRKLGEKNAMPAGIAPNKPFNLEDLPNFQVYEFSPNSKLDAIPGKSIKQGRRYLIAGRDWSIMMQSSIIKALHDVLGDRLGFGFTFDEWWKHWEKNFPTLSRVAGSALNIGTKGLTSNYPYDARGSRESTVDEALEGRPGYLEWVDPRLKTKPKFRVIEYFPSRNNKAVSHVLCGSDVQIIQQIIQIHFQLSSIGGDISNDEKFINNVSFKGLPKVDIWFLESRETRDPNYKPLRGRLGFRLFKTERYDKLETLERLTISEIRQIAVRIFDNFAKPIPHRWHRGKESFSYRDKPNGIETWGYCYAESDARELITKLLAVRGLPVNWGKFRHTTTGDPVNEFPINPPNKNVLGEIRQGDRIRPSGFVYFHSATISLQSLRNPISLCDYNGVTFDEDQFNSTS